MKIINFEGIEEYNVTINKKNAVPMENHIFGTKIEFIDSGVQDHVITKHTQYWIPSDKIECLKEKKGHYFVNNIEVNEENFKKVIKLLEKGV